MSDTPIEKNLSLPTSMPVERSPSKKLFKPPLPFDATAEGGTSSFNRATPPAGLPPVEDVASLETAPQPVSMVGAKRHDVTSFDTSPQPAMTGGIANQPGASLATMTYGLVPSARPLRVRRLVQHVRGLDNKSKVLLVTLLICFLSPVFSTIGYGINAYIMYSHARNGVQHLMNVKDIFTGLKAHPTGLLDANNLHRVQQEFVSAQNDFQQLHTMLNNDALLNIASDGFHVFDTQIASARSLSQIGVDGADIGQKLITTALTLAPSFHGSLLTDVKKPLITLPMLDLVRTTVEYILPRLNDIEVLTHNLSLDGLPISAQQRDQLLQIIQALPQAQADLEQALNLLSPLGWILGVDAPRVILVQTMDRAELRPTGGFTGQFGELQVNGARVAPFHLQNIGPIEENNPNSLTNGQLAPEQYRSWWPIANWGLRDSNLSADFPTSAQIAIKSYNFEFKRQVDGVILFSPVLIEHVLQIIGPIQVPEYKETITAQNLEERLHYYQLDNTAIRKEELVEKIPNINSPDAGVRARKLFTKRVGDLMISQLRHAPPNELLTIAREMLHDLRTKDLQVYVTNQQIEGLLMKYGAAAQMDRSLTHDGLYVVQANVSASKASQYVRTLIHDRVSLDARGGATHVMQLHLAYNQIGPVYGLDTYHDYIRVYVPPTSKFLWGYGFDSGIPFCGASAGYRACPNYDPYSDGTLICPAGQADPGVATSMFRDPFIGLNHPLDRVGPPTNYASDEPQRNMFGGWVVIPKNCSLTATLSWYVPAMGHEPYTLLVQRQSSTFAELDLTILPTPGDCGMLNTQGRHFDGVMSGKDLSFSVRPPRTPQRGSGCYPQPGI